MNVKAAESSSAGVNALELVEFYSGTREKRIVLPGWLPASESPSGRGSGLS